MMKLSNKMKDDIEELRIAIYISYFLPKFKNDEDKLKFLEIFRNRLRRTEKENLK